jgi:hypothetical protein
VVYLKILSRNFPGGTEESHERISQGGRCLGGGGRFGPRTSKSQALLFETNCSAVKLLIVIFISNILI